MQIRAAGISDLEAIRRVHLDAFDDEGESVAELAVSLMQDESARPVLALVGDVEGQIVGSVIFSSVRIEGAEHLAGYILAPLAVAKGFQRSGIGRTLIERGFEGLRQQGADVVFVLGDPGYYGRFGFSSRHRVRPPHELSYAEAWMALSLSGASLDSLSGRLICANSLQSPEHW